MECLLVIEVIGCISVEIGWVLYVLVVWMDDFKDFVVVDCQFY